MAAECFLGWIKVSVGNIPKLLWYLDTYPRRSRQEASTHEPVTAGPPVYLPLSVPVDTPASTIFALVIGIDKYNDKGVGNLHGCVADADGVQTFLIETLCVLPERILNLRNEGATRGEILKHVLNRATNTSIQEGDPILIYYAGHGGEANPPAGWAAGGEKIQMILPHDFIPRTSTSEGSQGILDVTPSVLLNKLSRAKGNNISVIFDCCHSGSGTRIDEDMPSPLVRGVKLPDDYAILPMVDEQILSDEDRATCVAKKFEKAEMASHVLLAACRASELARESKNMAILHPRFWPSSARTAWTDSRTKRRSCACQTLRRKCQVS